MMLSRLVSTAPERAPFPGRAGLLTTLSSEYEASLDAIDDDAFRTRLAAVLAALPRERLAARPLPPAEGVIVLPASGLLERYGLHTPSAVA